MKLVMAPMFGVTNMPFRLLCRRHGADWVYTEMISAKALSKTTEGKKTARMALFCSEEKPVSLQLFTNCEEWVRDAAREISSWEKKPDFIDLNFCCPSKNIVGQGGGCALMQNPVLCARIVETALDAGLPVSVKLRSGLAKENAVEVAVACERAGASLVAVHGRNCSQGFSGESDWQAIKRVKQAVGVQVTGSGDVRAPEDAERMLEETGCDNIMVGRAAMKDPFIFERTKSFLATGDYDKKTALDGLRAFDEYLSICKEKKMLEVQDVKMKLMWFTSSIPGSAKAREKISRAKSLEEIKKIRGELEATSCTRS